MSPTARESKTEILQAFKQLMAQQEKQASKVATKEEEAEKAKNEELLETVSSYTVDNIVNSMATLQLDFGTAINHLAENLQSESSKLDQLKSAIAVEKENLEQLQKIRLVADALYILRQEHQEQQETLETQTNQEREAITKDMAQTRKMWEREQQEFELKIQEETELRDKQREQEKADYDYETQRSRKMEMDEYEEVKRMQERELAEANQEKEKAWEKREQFLVNHQQELEEFKQQIATFDEQIQEAVNQARGEAIQEVERDGKVKADLFEKEWEAEKQGYEMTIQSLEAKIQRQSEEISELMSQLQSATTQAQNLAMRAFNTSNQPSA